MLNVSDKQKLLTIFGQSSYLIESAGDHLSAFATLLAPPIHSMAIYGCVRNLLEACAKALWLLDPRIDGMERIGRSFGMRFQDLREQQKLADVNPENPGAREFRNYAESRIKRLDQEARSMGYEKIRDRKTKKKISGIGRRVPTTVELCAQYLECSEEYRVLSGVTHGQFSALNSLSFQPVESEESKAIDAKGVQVLTKKLDDKAVIHFSTIAFVAFALTIWQQADYVNWAKGPLSDALSRCADGLAIDGDARFWR